MSDEWLPPAQLVDFEHQILFPQLLGSRLSVVCRDMSAHVIARGRASVFFHGFWFLEVAILHAHQSCDAARPSDIIATISDLHLTCCKFCSFCWINRSWRPRDQVAAFPDAGNPESANESPFFAETLEWPACVERPELGK